MHSHFYTCTYACTHTHIHTYTHHLWFNNLETKCTYMHTHTHAHAHTHCITVCPSLSLANGNVSYSPADRDIRSVATYTCNPGYRLSSPQAGMTRTCSVNGWSNQTFICERCEYISIGHAYIIFSLVL